MNRLVFTMAISTNWTPSTSLIKGRLANRIDQLFVSTNHDEVLCRNWSKSVQFVTSDMSQPGMSESFCRLHVSMQNLSVPRSKTKSESADRYGQPPVLPLLPSAPSSGFISNDPAPAHFQPRNSARNPTTSDHLRWRPFGTLTPTRP
jgi:hypothetical protein